MADFSTLLSTTNSEIHNFIILKPVKGNQAESHSLKGVHSPPPGCEGPPFGNLLNAEGWFSRFQCVINKCVTTGIVLK